MFVNDMAGQKQQNTLKQWLVEPWIVKYSLKALDTRSGILQKPLRDGCLMWFFFFSRGNSSLYNKAKHILFV